MRHDSATPVNNKKESTTANILLNNSLNSQMNMSRVQGAGHHYLNMSHATAPTHFLQNADDSNSFMDGGAVVNQSNVLNDYNLQAIIE